MKKRDNNVEMTETVDIFVNIERKETGTIAMPRLKFLFPLIFWIHFLSVICFKMSQAY